MSNDFLSTPHRGRAILITAIAVIVVAGLVFAGIYIGRSSTGPAATHATDTTASPSTAPAEEPTSLTIITGTDTIDGISVGYPHTAVGAVSASVEYTSQLLSTLDPDRAKRVGEIVGDPNGGMRGDDFRQAPLNSRKALGVSPNGEVPDGVSISLAPVAYQTPAVTDSHVNVLLLGYLSTTDIEGEEQLQIGVYPVAMTWHDDDWKWSPLDNGSDYTDLAVPLNDPRAESLGWRHLTR